eukprot:518493-Prorocentrum_lima.AAC.1
MLGGVKTVCIVRSGAHACTGLAGGWRFDGGYCSHIEEEEWIAYRGRAWMYGNERDVLEGSPCLTCA